MADEPTNLLTASKLARLLGISRSTITRMTQAGLLPYLPIGRHTRRYNLAEVTEALRKQEADRLAGKQPASPA